MIGEGSCAVLWQDTVIIFGGMKAPTLVQQYSFTSGQWNNLAPMGIDHYYHKCIILPQNKNEVSIFFIKNKSSYMFILQ